MFRQLPLAEWHRSRGARMVPFAGWEMPVQYEGIMKEHRAVRERAGLFDVSHMGEIRVHGPRAEAWLNFLTANDVRAIAPGEAQYSMFLNEAGGVIDDIIVYRLADDDFCVVVNAANTAAVLGHLSAHVEPGVAVEDESSALALFSLAGPSSPTVAAAAVGATLPAKPFTFTEAPFGGATIVVSRTGYTGERDSFEFFVPVAVAEEFATRLLAVGEGTVSLCGLGARDSLRIEACLPLYGHELAADRTPYESDLGWVVKLGKGEFIARAALAAPGAATPPRRIGYFVVEGTRQIPRAGSLVFVPGTDEPVGEITSGTFSPLLDAPIFMAFVDEAARTPGSLVHADVRGARVPARAVRKPFLALAR